MAVDALGQLVAANKTYAVVGIASTIIEGDDVLLLMGERNQGTPLRAKCSQLFNLTDLTTILAAIHATLFAPLIHASRHQNGGADEISVAGLSGQLADGQRASALTTTGADVVVSGSAAPSTGNLLTAVSPTVASWQPNLAAIIAPADYFVGPGGPAELNNARVATATATVTWDLSTANVVRANVPDAAITLAKLADLAQDQFIGRTTASTGVPQTATITAAARTVLDDTTVAAMVDTLGGAAATGTGGLVRATSPTLITPALGTPTALVLTNATGLPIAGGGTGATTAVGAIDAITTKGTNIASASTTNIAAATGKFVHITGTTTITAFGTAAAGVERVLVFDSALLLTYNATSLILPGGANVLTEAGDCVTFFSEGSGNWRCTHYQRRNYPPLSAAGASLLQIVPADGDILFGNNSLWEARAYGGDTRVLTGVSGFPDWV
jgi:hypothetical protein